MNSRIFSDGQLPPVEWAARDTPGPTRTSPVTSRLPPPTIAEDPRPEDVTPTARPPAAPTSKLSSNEYLLTPSTDHPPVTSPDPLTPGNVFDSAISQPNPPGWSPLHTDHRPYTQHSAPAEMGRPHKRLSGSESLQSTRTWDEVKNARLRTRTEREDTLEGIGEETPPEDHQEVVKVDDTLPEEKGGPLQQPVPTSAHSAPLLTATLAGTTSQQPHVDRVHVLPNNSGPAVGSASGRVVEWGTPFKVQWIRTDPLSFHRTKHLKNHWNGDVRFQFPPLVLTDLLFPA